MAARRSSWSGGGSRSYGEFPPYVRVADRKAQADREVETLQKGGRAVAPVRLAGRALATTFWGKAWCKNLESYSDYANRLPRGRSYLRSGAVVDLQITPGRATALVRGTRLYEVEITVAPLDPTRWDAIVRASTGKIGSLIDLLQGKLSGAVMEVMSQKDQGLFPTPDQLRIKCSCPDWATLCKHAAAALYGVGARLDQEPELLFRLAGVDPAELVSKAAEGVINGKARVAKEKVLDGDLASVFGIDLDEAPAAPAAKKPAAKKPAAKKPAAAPRTPRRRS